MPHYVQQGTIPKKRHTAFYRDQNDPTSLLPEQHMSREGFSGPYSNLYHLRMPTRLKSVDAFTPQEYKKASSPKHIPYHIRTARLKSHGNAIESRIPLFFNEDLSLYKLHITESMNNIFYKNAHHDELFYIQDGSGRIDSLLGEISYQSGDYIVIPRGIIWSMKIEQDTHAFLIESAGPIETPRRYRNLHGQLMEHSLFCERDIVTPSLPHDPIDDKTNTTIHIRVKNGAQILTYDHNPLDVVGWDGCYYPWKLSIHDIEPIVGRVHQPPPVHQTFQGHGFVVCSFVPRLFDFHPNAIPAPYPHSNVDSDEILFYSKGSFMSRRGIEAASITHHPMGIPHGPHPGLYEGSIGKKFTEECAVMVDTYKPLHRTQQTEHIADPNYPLSWL